MSISFASNLSMLRRELNITQKTAANDLQISQALLSHYEKGIRECNLDFVVKAAEYYDVTTDFLLGLSDSRHGNSELSDLSEIQSDTQIKTKTLLRAFLYLLQKAENDNEAAEEHFTDFFTMSVSKYIALTQKNDKETALLCDIVLNLMKHPKNKAQDSLDSSPEFINTVEGHAAKLLGKVCKKPR